MAYDENVAQRFRVELAQQNLDAVEEKNMFGALGFMVNGNLTMCVGDKDVMYKLGSDRCDDLIEQGIAEPVVMGKRTMKNWVNVSFHNLENATTFNELLKESINVNLHRS